MSKEELHEKIDQLSIRCRKLRARLDYIVARGDYSEEYYDYLNSQYWTSFYQKLDAEHALKRLKQ